MLKLNDFDVRPMQNADIPAVHRLSHSVGWPHRPDDWTLALRLGEGFVALRGHDVAGTVMWWRYGDSQARIGMVIVDPNLQRAGLGRQLMDACLSRLDGSSQILNATAAGEPLYLRLGFTPAETIEQYQGLIPASAKPNPGHRVRHATPSDFDAIVAIDQQAIGAPRPHVLQALIDVGEAVVIDGPAGLLGAAFVRRFGRGRIIGPLIASNGVIARDLGAYWLAQHPGEFLRIDTPPALGLAAMLDGFGLQKVDTVVTMVKGTPSSTGPMRCYAIASQALG